MGTRQAACFKQVWIADPCRIKIGYFGIVLFSTLHFKFAPWNLQPDHVGPFFATLKRVDFLNLRFQSDCTLPKGNGSRF